MSTLGIQTFPLMVVFTIDTAPGTAWQLVVSSAPDLLSQYYVKSGTGSTVFNETFSVGTHYAMLLIVGEISRWQSFKVLPVQYAPPAPPPPPPQLPSVPAPPKVPYNEGEQFQSMYGVSCEFRTWVSGFGRWYRLLDLKTGQSSPPDMSRSKLYEGYAASFKCGDPLPSAQSPALAPLQEQIRGESANIRETINESTNSILGYLGSIAAAITGILNAVTVGIPQMLTGITGAIGNIAGGIAALPGNISEGMSDIRQSLQGLSAWQANFSFPSWDEVIVQPVNALLQPARDVLEWTRNFRWPDWGGFFDAYVVGPLDVWFSNRLGIDPAKPFWDELEAKLYSLIRNMLSRLIDELTSDFPENQKKV